MKSIFIKQIALPTDHGSWVFLLSPLVIGLFAAPNWSIASLILIIGVFAGFLIRQPTTVVVKILSGRRQKRDLNTALSWIVIYVLY